MSLTDAKKAMASVTGVKDNTLLQSRGKRQLRKLEHRPSAWRKIWEDALREHYPYSVVSYSDRVAANLKRATEKRGFPKEDMGKFIEWVVVNWSHLRKSVFSFNPRIPRGPETPDMDFVIVTLPKLHSAFNLQKPEHALTRTMPGPQQTALAAQQAQAATPPTGRPANTSAGFSRGPVPRLNIDHTKARETQKRLGLKTWD